MIKLENGSYIIGFDDGCQFGKTSNFIFDNGVHKLGSVEPTLKKIPCFMTGNILRLGKEGRLLRRTKSLMMWQCCGQWRLSLWSLGMQESIKRRLCLR